MKGGGHPVVLHWHCQCRQLTYGARIPISSYEANISDDIALVTYTYDVPALNQTSEPWVREGDAWKNDDCG